MTRGPPASVRAGPPPLAFALVPLHALPWQVFIVGWTTLLFGAFWYLASEWSLPLIAAGFVGIATGIGQPVTTMLSWAAEGNVQLLLAAAAVAGMRHPSAWALPLLTKMTPGVGVLGFAFRGEWRRFGLAIGLTVALAALTFALDPGDWFAFVGWIATAGPSPVPIVPIPFAMLAAVAVGIIAFAARTDRPWLVPVACGICTPALYMWSFVPFWIGAAVMRGPGNGSAARGPADGVADGSPLDGGRGGDDGPADDLAREPCDAPRSWRSPDRAG
jgi:hypothetical protein